MANIMNTVDAFFISMQAVLKLLLIAFAGVMLEKCGYMDCRLRLGIAKMIYYCLLPCLLFTSIAANISMRTVTSLFVLPLYGALTPLLGVALGLCMTRVMPTTEKFGWRQATSCIGLGNSGYLPLVFVPAVILMDPFNSTPEEGEAKSEMVYRLSQLGMSYVSTYHIAFMPVLWFFGRRYLINPYKTTQIKCKERTRNKVADAAEKDTGSSLKGNQVSNGAEQSRRKAPVYTLKMDEKNKPVLIMSEPEEVQQTDTKSAMADALEQDPKLLEIDVSCGGSTAELTEVSTEEKTLQHSSQDGVHPQAFGSSTPLSTVSTPVKLTPTKLQSFSRFNTSALTPTRLPFLSRQGSGSSCAPSNNVLSRQGSGFSRASSFMSRQNSNGFLRRHQRDILEELRCFPVIRTLENQGSYVQRQRRRSSEILSSAKYHSKVQTYKLWRFWIGHVTELTCLGSACFGLIAPLKSIFFSSLGEDMAYLEPTITNAMRTLGAAVSPIVTILLGANILAAQRKGAEGKKVDIPKVIIAICLFGKLVILPIIGTVLVYFTRKIGGIMDNDPVLMFVILTQFCAPSAQNLTLMCELANHGQKEISIVLFYMHLVAIVTMTVWATFYLYFINNVLLKM